MSNSTGTPAVVVHDDPAAAQIYTWIEWVIPLQAFADQGIVLTNVDRIASGLGNKGNMTIPGGLGKMFIDDIRLYLGWRWKKFLWISRGGQAGLCTAL